ncbi:MAG: type III-A CRISPR-associated protein Csm2, partial [Campylobacterales bacterium]|nr:type III-A CRISPR-associated protein Csm2 [Campylobacterales bacterium]
MAYQGNNNYKSGQNNNRPNNNQEEKVEVKEILLDYELQEQLFGEIAQNWAKKIEKEKRESKDKLNKSSQIRRFYDAVLELNEKAQNKISDEAYKKEVYPFVVMLNSKV